MTLNAEYGTMGSKGVVVPHYPHQELLRLKVDDLKELWKEAEECFNRREYIQACEKYYKVAEECVKILSEWYAPRAVDEVKKLRNWTTFLLNSAVTETVENTGWKGQPEEDIFRSGWQSAVTLHREGFHEHALDYPSIKYNKDKVWKMKNLIETKLKEIERNIFSGTTAGLSGF